MTAPAAVKSRPLRPGHVEHVASRAVRCSKCEKPTPTPVFMGVTDDGARLPLWCCPPCASREVKR